SKARTHVVELGGVAVLGHDPVGTRLCRRRAGWRRIRRQANIGEVLRLRTSGFRMGEQAALASGGEAAPLRAGLEVVTIAVIADVARQYGAETRCASRIRAAAGELCVVRRERLRVIRKARRQQVLRPELIGVN